MKYLYILLLFVAIPVGAQESWEDFSGKERAFLYHQTRRVEILNAELFHLFEYKDSLPFINDTLPDYGYAERQIVEDPDLLELHTDQMGRKSDGLLNDLCIRFALWELDQVLQFRNSTAEEDKPLKDKLKVFEKYVLEKVPQSAVRTLNNGDYVLEKTLQGYYAPTLTVSDKMAAIVNSGYSQLDQMLILNAIMTAEEKYVSIRAAEIYKVIGGVSKKGFNYLSAVGDGSSWAEVVGGFNTPYTIGLPDEKGLFNFVIEQVLDEEKEKNDLKVKAIERKQHKTNSDKKTVVHLDVFGYHPERQTTFVIQKGGNSYVLYGKNEHRLVSPDSTYGEGTTYWRLMNRLEFYHIANLKANLYGKRGYEYQIDKTEKTIEAIKLRIKETEFKLDKLRYTPEGKPKIKKKKIKKKHLGASDQAGRGHPTSALSKNDKKKIIEQNRLVHLNGELDSHKRLLEKLKDDMEKAFIRLVFCETKLDYMRKTMGYVIMEYEVENHIYTFKDGATFNYLTQDFVFPLDRSEEVFQLYHISFGEKVFDERIDENFSHVNVSTSLSSDKYVLSRIVRDAGSKKLTVSDSIQIREIFQYLSMKDIDPKLTVNAGGIVGERDGVFYRDSLKRVVDFDPESDVNNGVEIYKANLMAGLSFGVTVYDDDMLPFNFEVYRAAFEKASSKNNGLNEVDFYTGIRAKKAAEDWVDLLKEMANKWLEDGEDKRRVESKLKKLKVKKVFFPTNDVLLKVPSMSL